jgi:hypothetical protein
VFRLFLARMGQYQRGRRVPWLVAIAALAVSNAGCGGVSQRVAGPAGGQTTTAKSVPQSINLRAADVPTMTASTPEHQLDSGEVNVQLAHCDSGLPGWEAGSWLSPKFSAPARSGSPVEVIESAVRLVSNEATAREHVEALGTSRVRSCLERVLGSAHIQRGPLTEERTSVSALPVVLTGNAPTFGLRVRHKTVHRAAGSRSHVLIRSETTEDIIGFAYHAALVSLTNIHESGAATAVERRLLSVLYRRANTYVP